MLWSGLCCYTEGWGGKCSEILATIKLLYNPRVNKYSLHKKVRSDLNYVLDIKRYTSTKCANCRSRNLTYELFSGTSLKC